MKNKRISKLVDPSFRLYFIVGFAFAAVTTRVSVPLAICEAAATAFLWWYFRHTAQKRREGIRKYIDDMTDDMTTADKASMLSAPFAMMVFRPDTQEILWSNDSFMQLTGVREDLFDNRIDDVLPDFPTHWLLEGKSECPETVMLGERHFRVFGNLSHPSARRGGQGLLATTYWTDVTEQDALREENERRRPIVSVIVIDNYEELMKAGSEASRSAVLAAIDEKLNAWLQDSHSLLRKFDRNRYMLVTTEQEYQKLLEGKFSVLDAVRSVVTEDGVAATLSIGVGKDVDDYETLYQNAMLSIEMALSRGGDQVVVRNRLDFEFYGGKSKSTEKRTKVKSRVMANALGELISDAGHAVVIDPAADAQTYDKILKEHHVPLTAILCTHGHYDHVGSAKALQAEWNAKLYCEKADLAGDRMYPLSAADYGYAEGESIAVDELTFTVWHTPGHTPGSVVLLCGEYLFCGDTLFAGSIGRTDLEGGSSAQMAESLRKLAKLPIPRETQVLPGHGEFSTFGDELDNNYFIRSAVRGNNDLF